MTSPALDSGASVSTSAARVPVIQQAEHVAVSLSDPSLGNMRVRAAKFHPHYKRALCLHGIKCTTKCGRDRSPYRHVTTVCGSTSSEFERLLA